jgi:hypothetical protein
MNTNERRIITAMFEHLERRELTSDGSCCLDCTVERVEEDVGGSTLVVYSHEDDCPLAKLLDEAYELLEAETDEPQPDESPATKALIFIERYGGIDGDHHKQWVLDQVVRALTGDGYEQWVVEQCDGEDGPNTYEWDEGIAP